MKTLLPLLVALAYVDKGLYRLQRKKFRRSQTINFLVCLSVCGDFFLNHLKSSKLLNFLELDSKYVLITANF